MKELIQNKTFIITAIIALVLMITNPSEQKHKDEVAALVLSNINKNVDLEANPYNALVVVFAQSMVNNMVRRNDYILFSITEINYLGATKTAGVGVLGMVFISNDIINGLGVN
jgi:hypothetical protein